MPTSPTGSRRQRGFTLIELLVVLTLLALIAGFALPRLATGTGPAALKSAVLELAGALRETRTQAIAAADERVLVLDTGANRYGRGAQEAAATGLPADISLTVEAAEVERLDERRIGIRFFPTGGSTGGRITLQAGERRFLVKVDWLTGRVSVAALEGRER